MDDLRNALIRLGVDLLATQLRQSITPAMLAEWQLPSEPARARLERAAGYVGTTPRSAAQSNPVLSIFCLVENRDGQSLSDHALPQRISNLKLVRVADAPKRIWDDFCAEFGKISSGDGAFETFTHMMAKYGATTCGSTPLQHISVYEQFKATAALAFLLSDDATPDQVCLVSGDLPGIQEMLYTITSKGAAKGLRGRSFYLQLLSDVLVRCILRELDLPSVCVIFNAGGNFKLLARDVDESKLEAIRLDLARRMYALHRGELRVALAWTRADADDLAQPEFSKAVQRTDEQLAIEKRQPWKQLLEEDDFSIFEPIGFGSLIKCAVCDVEMEASKDGKCAQCRSFEELAREIARTSETPELSVTSVKKKLADIPLPEKIPLGKPTWEQALAAFGYEYRFADQARAAADTVRYRLNDANFLDSNLKPVCAYAFRPLANFTPFVTEHDTKILREFFRKRRMPEDELPSAGEIRSTGIMSEFDSTGIERFGVLRMDVDWLGEVWSKRLRSPNMLVTSALSGALTLFFEGWLNEICQAEAKAWKEKLAKEKGFQEEANFALQRKEPYVIYSGGDDLFIVGPWDVLPQLAIHIRRDWESFVRRGYVDDQAVIDPAGQIALPLTISAGIFIESDKFPLYQAADHAKSALEKAKDREIFVWLGKDIAPDWRTTKDAVCFLGTTVAWDDFTRAEQIALGLARMSKTGEGGRKLAHGFLALLLAIARAYRKDMGNAPSPEVKYGRWMWKLAYGLRRAEEQYGKQAQNKKEVIDVTKGILGLNSMAVESTRQWRTIEFLELPVRWAEFLIRRKAAK